MAIAATSIMAASTCGQAFRSCLSRNRDRNDTFSGSDVPNSKRVCAAAAAGRESHSVSAEKNNNLALNHEKETLQLFSATASKMITADGDDGVRKKNSGWEALELCLVERITRSLSVTDLCRLSQVSKHYRDMCGRDEVWTSRAWEEKDLKLLLKRKASGSNGVSSPNVYSSNSKTPTISWKTTTTTTTETTEERLHAIPFTASTQLHFSGDITILDPFELFVTQREELEQIIKEHKYQDLVLKYRGIESALLRTSCGIDGDDNAFEVFRGGEEVGANVTSSGVVAVVPKQLVLKLGHENAGLQLPLELHEVTVEAVDGFLRRSLDGDFIISHKEPARRTKVELPFNREVESADVVCSTGGSWTEYTDSDDDEEDLTDEEMVEALQEAAVLTILESFKSSENITTTTTITSNPATKLDLSLQSCS